MTDESESGRLCVLITNTAFSLCTGSELYVRDLAFALQRLGHVPVIYSPRLGALAEQVRARAIPVVDNLDALGQAPDLIHGQHHLETMTALARFPGTPALYACHGCLPWQESPPLHPRILHYLAVNEAVRDRLVFEAGVPPDKVTMALNFVDLQRFLPRSPLPARPVRALIFSNYARESNYVGIVRECCRRRGISLDVIGYANGNPCAAPESILGAYDLIFARGRAAIESLAVGAAVICCDHEGLGEMVTPQNLEHLRRNNFGLRVLDRALSPDLIDEQIDRYDPASAAEASLLTRASAGLDQAVLRIVECYREVLGQWRADRERGDATEAPALSRYLRQVSVMSQQLAEDANHWRHGHAEISARIECTAAQFKQEVDTLRIDADRLHAQADGHRAEVTGLRAETTALNAELHALRAEAQALRSELQDRCLDLEVLGAQAAKLSEDNAVERAQWQRSQDELQAGHAAQLVRSQSESAQLHAVIRQIHGTLTWRWRDRVLAIAAIRRAYLFLASRLRPRPAISLSAAPGAGATPEFSPLQLADAQLACVVMGLGNPASLIAAVRSLQLQDPPVEIVVVNSGGGSPVARLRAAGIEVKTVHRPDVLYPGAVRNLGVAATSAPFVAFLAADCRAEPGWVRARLQSHLEGRRAVSSAVTPARPRNLWSWVSYLNLFARRMPGVPPELALHYGVSYQRSLFDQFGSFREDLRSGEDSEFNQRLTAVDFSWTPAARSAHEHPSTLVGLLRDQYGRGTRIAAAWERLSGQPSRRRVAVNAFRRAPGLLRTGWKAAESRQRPYLVMAAAMMPLAVMAYALGALAGTPPVQRPPTKGPARPRLLALLTFHNEMRYLPDYFLNLAPHVNGIIALDDGSDDGSGEFVEQQAAVRELIRLPKRSPHVWDEPRNHHLLVEAALRHGADWLLVVDADERVERSFRSRADAEIVRAEAEGTLVLTLAMRELWNHADHFRCDGIWDRKRPARMFKARPDHHFDDRPLHGHWAPLNSMTATTCREADLIIYHLRMVTELDRRNRQAKFQRLDPDRKFQAIGYDYLTDTTELRLEQLPSQRDYHPPHAA